MKVDVSGVQQNDKPTRDVLVVFDDSGDREFVGFGSAKNGEFADCFMEADKLPKDAIKVCARDDHSQHPCRFCRPCSLLDL